MLAVAAFAAGAGMEDENDTGKAARAASHDGAGPGATVNEALGGKLLEEAVSGLVGYGVAAGEGAVAEKGIARAQEAGAEAVVEFFFDTEDFLAGGSGHGRFVIISLCPCKGIFTLRRGVRVDSLNLMRMRGKSIVIVGGSTGMGLSAAKALHREGARLVLVGRSLESLQAARSALDETVGTVAGDAIDSATAETAVAQAVEAFGKLDGLYHVAGGSGRRFGDGPLHELTDEGWQRTCDLNLSSLIWSNRAAVKQFLKQESVGVILNMASVLGYSPSPDYFSTHGYAATKAAALGFSKSIAAYYANRNIRVNVIAPALVETPMAKRAAGDEAIQEFIQHKQPLEGGRIGLPGDADGAAVFLLSDESAYITGQVLAVDGGWTVSEGHPRKGFS